MSDVNSDKAKALQAALAQIEKQFGKGTIMRLGEGEAIEDIQVVSTGSLGLDIALGIGGLPRGRVIEIYGPESSGKTTLTLQVIAEMQKLGGTCAFIDAEHALDIQYAQKLGVNLQELLISQPDTGEQALEIVDALVRSGSVDLVVIDTPDAVLVADRARSQDVRRVVAQIERQRREEHVLHRKVHRPWGWYDCLDEGDRFKVKRIMVRPGASLSLQRHSHRAEHWVVIAGTARVTCGEKTFDLQANESTYIPQGVVHRLANPGADELEVIEVQTGSYFGEDDIIRIEDAYDRITS